MKTIELLRLYAFEPSLRFNYSLQTYELEDINNGLIYHHQKWKAPRELCFDEQLSPDVS